MAGLARSRILIVDDDANHRAMLRTLLSEWGAGADEAGSGEEAVALSGERPYDLILMDVQMAGMTGIEALREIRAYNPAVPVLIMTAYADVENAVEAVKAGAYDYLPKPLEFDEFRLTLDRALDHAALRRENRRLRERLGGSFDNAGIIGASPLMRNVLETLSMVAPSEATVLICGESGTGKELFARAVHANGRRKKGPFVDVNCAALSENLLESELFGHEKGAFTGADRRREGLFSQADQGTIFLDEIGEISPSMQVKLLRVLQEREFQRVGGDRKIRVDVRIVAATNRNLREEVTAGRFRQDLFFRLNVVTLIIPPLRDRMEDVPFLAASFLERFAARNNKPVRGFTPGAVDRMMRYSWPGNVRELENAVERSVVLLVGDYVTERELPPSVAGDAADAPASAHRTLSGLSLQDAEKIVIAETMKNCGGNKTEAAKFLGVTRKTLLAKMTRHGMIDGGDSG
jgi:two-component system response regulator HydG